VLFDLSLQGPLRGKKQYLRTILEPHSIRLESITGKASSENPAYYELIWRTTTVDSEYQTMEEVVEGHLEGVSVRVEPSTLETSRIARVRGRTVSYIYQHRAIVELTARSRQTRLV
jgi:hypothetical protein